MGKASERQRIGFKRLTDGFWPAEALVTHRISLSPLFGSCKYSLWSFPCPGFVLCKSWLCKQWGRFLLPLSELAAAQRSPELRWLQWGQAKFRKLGHKEEAMGAGNTPAAFSLPCLAGQCTWGRGSTERARRTLFEGSRWWHPPLPPFPAPPASSTSFSLDPPCWPLPIAFSICSLQPFLRSLHRSGVNCFLGKTGQCNAFGATFPRYPRNPVNFPAPTSEILQKFPWQGYPVV